MSPQNKHSVQDLRVFRRVPFAASIELQPTDRPAFTAQTDNLSEGGILVLTRTQLPLMSQVTARFVLFESTQIQVEGVIRWVRPEGALPAALGIEFTTLSETDVQCIARFVEQLEPMAWTQEPDEGMALPREVAAEYVPIIRRIAHAQAKSTAKSRSVAVDDLIGAGFVGLLEAYRSYRANAGVPFDYYAKLRIRGAMRDETRSADPLTRTQREMIQRLRQAQATLARSGRTTPTHAELANALGVSEATVDEHLILNEAMSTEPSMDEQIADTSMPSSSAEEPFFQREQAQMLSDALSALPTKLRNVLQMYYGDAMTLRSIASVLGVSEARVSQLHSDAVKRLRDAVS